MVMLHGCGQDADGFARSTRMNALARRERFIVLYPEQDRMANLQGCWNWFDTRSGRAQAEAGLVMQAIDQACLLYPIDPGRVAIAGLSAGASLAALLATRHPERFKAVVMHSGVPPGSADTALRAIGAMRRGGAPTPAAPALAGSPPWPALMVIHGSADNVVAPANAHTAVARWAEAAGAQAVASRGLQRGQRYPATITDYRQRGQTVATLVEVTGLGHGWSGGAVGQAHGDARGPDASRMVWAFAARQFRT
jgi:poly(hydroxyalkanoate) depolymerase family esterase